MQNALFATLTTGVGLNTDLTKGVFDRLRSLPIARWSPLAGRILADTVKQVVGDVAAARRRHDPRLPGRHRGRSGCSARSCLLLVFALAVSWIVGAGRRAGRASPEKVQIFGFVVIFPLTFTSNAFVPTDTMPGWLQALGQGQPGDHPGRRPARLLVGGPVATPVVQSLLWAVAIAAVFAPLAVRALRRRV